MFDAKNKLSGKFGAIKERMTSESGVTAGITNSMKEFKAAAAEQLPDIVDEVVSAKIQGRSATFALQEKLENWRQQEMEKCLSASLDEARRAYQESIEESLAEQRGGSCENFDDEELQGGIA